MKITDVSYNFDFIIENSSKFVLLNYNNSIVTEQKIDKQNFENVLIQINTLIQQKLKAEAAKKRKAPSLSMLSNVLTTYNFQPNEIEDIFVKSGIDPMTAKKATSPKMPISKKSRADATVPTTAADPKEKMKKILTDLTKNPYLTPTIQTQMADFKKEMLKQIDKGMDKEQLEKKIRWQIRIMKNQSVKENASGGATSSGSVASIANPGGPMMPMIKRMPPGQSFFAPYQVSNPKRSKKKAKKR